MMYVLYRYPRGRLHLRYHVGWGSPRRDTIVLGGEPHRLQLRQLPLRTADGRRMALGRLQRQHRLRHVVRADVRGRARTDTSHDKQGRARAHEPPQQRSGQEGEANRLAVD